MCNHVQGEREYRASNTLPDLSVRREPQKQLAELIGDKMGVGIDPDALARFIRENWRAIAVLAHRVHEA